MTTEARGSATAEDMQSNELQGLRPYVSPERASLCNCLAGYRPDWACVRPQLGRWPRVPLPRSVDHLACSDRLCMT